MKRCYPLPEALDGNPWSVEPGRGSCDTVGRVLRVPLSSSDADRFVRAHELGHARITPRVAAYKQARRFAISMQALQSVEDLRVHTFLNKAGVGPLRGMDFYEAECLVRSNLNNERNLGRALVSSWGTEDGALLTNILSGLLSEEVLNQMLNKVRLVYDRLMMGKGIHRWIGLRNCTVPAARLFDTLFPENDERPADYGNVPIETLKSRRTGGRWGEMEIQTLTQSMRRSISPIAQSRIFRDEGSRLVAPYRITVDGRVFCHKKRQVGGTVLIDVSGSMSLSLADLKKIVRVAPAATIATYSGSGKNGTLSIIGEKGRLVDDRGLEEANCFRGNIIDGPALRWLALEQEPRIWVSDGLVTGVHDHHTIDLAVDAQRICTRAKIRRVSKADAVVDLLKAITHRGRIHGSS